MKILTNVALPTLPFIVCDDAGEILRIGEAPGQMVDIQAQAGEHAYAGTADPEIHYIDLVAQTLLLKPEIHVEVAGTTITGLPTEATLVIGDEQHAVAGPSVTLDIDVPGSYFVTITAKNYRPARVVVVVEGAAEGAT